MGVAAYMTVVLVDLLGTLPVQYREVQGTCAHYCIYCVSYFSQSVFPSMYLLYTVPLPLIER